MAETILDELEAQAKALHESANALAARLLDEGLRRERHPLIYFRLGGSGQRRPALVGTRLCIWQIISTLRGSKDIADAADYLGLTEPQVRAAVAYYADYTDEVDAYAAEEEEFARRERERWEREQQVLGA